MANVSKSEGSGGGPGKIVVPNLIPDLFQVLVLVWRPGGGFNQVHKLFRVAEIGILRTQIWRRC